MALLHALQGVAVLVLSRAFSVPVSTSFLAFDPASRSLVPASATVFSLSLPWLVVAIYLWSGYANGNAAPTFVYWIFGSIFLFFNCFAVNMWLQHKKVGPWKDYLYGERAYILLSLVAKSLLAWQVFAGTLRP